MSTLQTRTPARRLTRRRGTALLLGGSLVLGLAACAIPDGPVTAGTRPNQPTAVTTPTFNPETDPARLALPLASVPAYRAATPNADGWTTNAMTDAPGDFTWRVVDAERAAGQGLPAGRHRRVRRPADLHPGAGRAGVPRQQRPQRARLRHGRGQGRQAAGGLDPGHRRGARRRVLLARSRLDRAAAARQLARGHPQGDGLRRRVRERPRLHRGGLPHVHRRDLPPRPGHRQADQGTDRHRLRLQGHRLDRPARLPAAVRRAGPRRHGRCQLPLAVPGLRPDPEQAGRRLERDRPGCAAQGLGRLRLVGAGERRVRHPDRAGARTGWSTRPS